jgi:PPE-repeat protein
MTPFQSPQSNTTSDGVANQSDAVSQAANTPAGNVQSLLSNATLSPGNVPNSAAPAAAPTAGSLYDYLTAFFGNTNNTAAGQFLSSNFFSNSILNGSIAGGEFNPQYVIASVQGVLAAQHATTLGGLGDFAADAEGFATADLSSSVAPAGLTSATSGVGQAHLVGSMSVPQSWTNAANISPGQTAVQATGVTGLTDTGAAPAAGGPGGVAGPLGGTGRRLRRAIPKYGFRPVVMPRPPAAG